MRRFIAVVATAAGLGWGLGAVAASASPLTPADAAATVVADSAALSVSQEDAVVRDYIALEDCSPDGDQYSARGRAVNPTDGDLAFEIEVFFATEAGTVVARSSATASVAAGETEPWAALADTGSTENVRCVIGKVTSEAADASDSGPASLTGWRLAAVVVLAVVALGALMLAVARYRALRLRGATTAPAAGGGVAPGTVTPLPKLDSDRETVPETAGGAKRAGLQVGAARHAANEPSAAVSPEQIASEALGSAANVAVEVGEGAHVATDPEAGMDVAVEPEVAETVDDVAVEFDVVETIDDVAVDLEVVETVDDVAVDLEVVETVDDVAVDLEVAEAVATEPEKGESELTAETEGSEPEPEPASSDLPKPSRRWWRKSKEATAVSAPTEAAPVGVEPGSDDAAHSIGEEHPALREAVVAQPVDENERDLPNRENVATEVTFAPDHRAKDAAVDAEAVETATVLADDDDIVPVAASTENLEEDWLLDLLGPDTGTPRSPEPLGESSSAAEANQNDSGDELDDDWLADLGLGLDDVLATPGAIGAGSSEAVEKTSTKQDRPAKSVAPDDDDWLTSLFGEDA